MSEYECHCRECNRPSAAPEGAPREGDEPEWCTECQSFLGHRRYCSKFILCTREVVRALTDERDQALEAVGDLIGIAEGAMKEANRDGAEYNVKEDLAEYRALIAKHPARRDSPKGR